MTLNELTLTIATAGANRRVARAKRDEELAIAAHDHAAKTLEQELGRLQRALNDRGTANETAHVVLQSVLEMLGRFDEEADANCDGCWETAPRITIEHIQKTLRDIDSAMNVMLGVSTGAATTAAAWAAVSAFGTASTGAAIGALHGIAAHNAAMAWFGGGALAAGGGGMALGAAVLGGVTAVAAIAVNAVLAHRKANQLIGAIKANVEKILEQTRTVERQITQTRAATERTDGFTAQTRLMTTGANEKLAFIRNTVSELQGIASNLTDLMNTPVLNTDGTLTV
jgi:hypothetical protein